MNLKISKQVEFIKKKKIFNQHTTTQFLLGKFLEGNFRLNISSIIDENDQHITHTRSFIYPDFPPATFCVHIFLFFLLCLSRLFPLVYFIASCVYIVGTWRKFLTESASSSVDNGRRSANEPFATTRSLARARECKRIKPYSFSITHKMTPRMSVRK